MESQKEVLKANPFPTRFFLGRLFHPLTFSNPYDEVSRIREHIVERNDDSTALPRVLLIVVGMVLGMVLAFFSSLAVACALILIIHVLCLASEEKVYFVRFPDTRSSRSILSRMKLWHSLWSGINTVLIIATLYDAGRLAGNYLLGLPYGQLVGCAVIGFSLVYVVWAYDAQFN